MRSGSQGATQEDIEKVLDAHGYEAEKPPIQEVTEPKRDEFESDEAFETAKEEFDAKQEEVVEEEEEHKEKERLAALPKPTRRQRAVEKATKELREELRKSNERLAALEGKTPRARAAEEPKQPKREEFKTDAEFDDAMFDYRYQLRRAKEQTTEAQNAFIARQKENLESYQTQVAAFKEEHDDWDTVTNQNLPVHESVQLAIIELENGPQVTYYLGKHPDYARELADMSPIKAVVEIARLADKLKAGAPAEGGKPKPRPRALPEPVKPNSTAATSSTLTSREASQKRDYRAFKAAQRRGV
jgi:hypothetical protein